MTPDPRGGSPEPSYDEVAYPGLPLTQTQPDRMATQAILLGCRAPDVSTARVLELGCSDAGNLAWLAAYAPGASFLGVDLSAAAVARGRAATAELTNLDVEQADLSELDAGRFDFVIAHGVYSWLPAPDALLACIDRHLGDDGIAYVSYNTRPGFHVRELAGEVMRHHAGSQPDRLPSARAVQEWIRATRVDTVHAGIMRQAMDLAAAKPDHVLIHDELAGHHHAPFFDEFAQAVAGHELAYLTESHVADAELPGVDAPAELLPHGEQVAEMARQQLLDFARNRAFRQSLLVRPGNRPTTHRADPARIADLWAAAPAERRGAKGERITFRVLGGVELSTDNSDLAADLLALGEAWPASVPVSALLSDPRALLRIYLGKGLELRTSPVSAVRPGKRPTVAPYVRARAAVGSQVANCRHDLLSLDDALARRAVALMDGHVTRSEISRALAARAAGQPGAPVDFRGALDKLVDQLGAASLMIG